MLSSEIVIVGAGPAGCATSMFLSKKKIKHTILDKAVFPRDKICGDALSGKTLAVLNKYDPQLIQNLYNTNPTQVLGSFGCVFAAPNGKSIDIPFVLPQKTDLKAPPGFLATRLFFDNFLFEQLNHDYATVIQGAACKKVERQGALSVIHYVQNGVTKTLPNVKLVVAADSERSQVKKSLLNTPREKNHFAAGIRAYYTGVTGFHEQHYIELHFLKDVLPGYLWIFPMSQNTANIGLGMLSSKVSAKNINLPKLLESAIANNPTIAHRFKNAKPISKIEGWGLPLGTKQRPISGDGFLLTGDAASLIDPFTGEGIGNALHSGMVAAHCIVEAIEQNNFSADFLKRYDQTIYKNLGSELKISTTLLRLCNFPWLFNLVVNKAHRSASLRNTISCMFLNLDIRAKLKNPLFYLKLLFS
ncbi:MAG: NAD(P)/FAD-dependent oxidoreductase [Alphaproteobacteria bacterium]|nr:NAD(P)/FAD-dependent oxidoreductase [Alphaproteobacteria bacterium]